MTTTGSTLTPADHLSIHVDLASYLLVDRLRNGVEEPQHILRRHPHLRAGFERTVTRLPDDIAWADVPKWYEKYLVGVEADAGDTHLPLCALAAAGALGLADRLALVLAGVVEDMPCAGAIFGELQPSISAPRPTLSTIGSVLHGFRDAADSLSDLQRSLVDNELVDVINTDDPRPDWLVRVPIALWNAISDRPSADTSVVSRSAADAPAIDELAVPPEFRSQLANVVGVLASGRLSALILRAGRGTGRDDVAAAVAGALGRGTFTIDVTEDRARLRHAGAVAAASGSVPVIVAEPGPGGRCTLDVLPCWPGPVVIIVGNVGGVEGRAVERAITLTMPLEGRVERQAIWRRAIPGAGDDDINRLSRRFLLPAGHLRRVASEAAAITSVDGRSAPTFDDVVRASAVLDRSSLETRAMHLPPRHADVGLVTTPVTSAKLAHLGRRCRHREELASRAGVAFGGETTRGVRAMFTGRSGTGKTLAARILAAELGMELYRVDLATTINKYVGETEKNLHEVLSTAEEHDIVLLIDEGDALLSSRTEVRSANDRYANLETDYLLQRLESHHGIVLITTNLTENIDQAFQRRMDVVVEFPEPGPFERLELWNVHLPADHRIGLDRLEVVADRCNLTGGQIRNAALYATLLAVDDETAVNGLHLDLALESEYAKAGASSPLAHSGARSDQHQSRQAFLEGLR